MAFDDDAIHGLSLVLMEVIGDWALNEIDHDDNEVVNILVLLPSLEEHQLIEIWAIIFFIWANIFLLLGFRWTFWIPGDVNV